MVKRITAISLKNPVAILSLTVAVLLTGCAGNKLKTTHAAAYGHIPKPQIVLVEAFAFSPSVIKTSSSPLSKIENMLSNDDERTRQEALGKEVVGALQSAMIEKLKEAGLNAVPAAQNAEIKAGSLVIAGRITGVDEGNRTRRNVIGLGAGQSSVDCEVTVTAMHEGNKEELLGLRAHGDSGSMPGAAVMGPAGAAAGAGTAATVGVNVAKGAAGAYTSASAHEAESMAGDIVKEVRSLAVHQGWINP